MAVNEQIVEIEKRLGRKVISEVYELEAVWHYMVEPGILVADYQLGILIDMELIRKSEEIRKKLVGNVVRPEMTITFAGLNSSKEVKTWSSSKNATLYRNCVAVVSKNLIHRLFGEFFIKVQKPKLPVKMFENTTDALNWLEQSIVKGEKKG